MTALDALYPEIVIKSWEDNAFRSELLSNPKAALSKLGGEFATAIQEVGNIKVLADTPDTVHIVLPANPVEMDTSANVVLERISVVNSSTLKGCTMQGPNCATTSYTRPCSRECK